MTDPAPGTTPTGPEIDRVDTAPTWDDALRLTIRRHGRVAFACTVTERPAGLWLVTDCLPARRGPDCAALLLAACDHLVVEQGAADVIAVHPELWGSWLQDAGAEPLQRMIAMRLDLDQDLLRMHARPLPDPYSLDRIGPSAAALEPLIGTDGDRATWNGALTGEWGTPVPGAGLTISADGTVRSAIAVTEYGGAPFVAHCAVAPRDRGNGLGRAVLLASMLSLLDAGYVDCRLSVEADNWTARRLYRSVGFVEHGPALRVSHLPGKPR